MSQNIISLDGSLAANSPFANVSGIKLESFTQPIVLLRIPTKGKCPVSGLCRTTLYSLTSGENPPVETIKFSDKSTKARGGRYIVARSLFLYLLKHGKTRDRDHIAALLFGDPTYGEWPGEELMGGAPPPSLNVSANPVAPLLASLAAVAQVKGAKPSSDVMAAISDLSNALVKAARTMTPAQLAALGYALPTAFRSAQAHAGLFDPTQSVSPEVVSVPASESQEPEVSEVA